MNTKTKMSLIVGVGLIIKTSISKLKKNSLIGTPSQWNPILPSSNKEN